MASKSRLFSKLLGSGTSGTIPQTSISSNVNFGVKAYDNISTLPLSGNDIGDQAFVDSDNRLYIWTGEGWYNVALINTNPNITGGYKSKYYLDINGLPTIITLIGNDPEGIPLTWSHEITSGSLTNNGGITATITNIGNVFTITPTTNVQYAGNFTVTFKASDGIGIGTAISEFTLEFIIENSKYTTLLAKAVDDAQNATFVDTSANSNTITSMGDVYQGSFSPYNAKGHSVYFDSDGDWFRVQNSSDFVFTGDFTIEAWVCWPYGPDVNYNPGHGIIYSGNSFFSIRWRKGNWEIALNNESGTIIVPNHYPIANTWYHIAYERNGPIITVYIDGVASGFLNYSGTLGYSSQVLSIGAGVFGNYGGMQGYIADLRIVNGRAVYKGNFTSIPGKCSLVENTVLLTCRLPAWADESTSDHIIEKYSNLDNNIYTSNFTPFGFNPYLSENTGGSAYFDGNSDYLTISASDDFVFGNGDFNIEAWIYPTTADTERVIFSNWQEDAGAFIFKLNSENKLEIKYNTVEMVLGTPNYSTVQKIGKLTVPDNKWSHVAIVRYNNAIYFYINGISHAWDSSYNETATIGYYNGVARDLIIGASSDITNLWNGYISDLRIVKGSAIYTSGSAWHGASLSYLANFNVPAKTLTATTDTVLLLNFTNGSVIDCSQENNLKLLGNATGSNTQTKNAPYSMYFDGTGDYLSFLNNSSFAFGTGAFTIEFWINSSSTTDKFILGGRSAIGTMHITIGGYESTAGTLRYVGSSTIISGSTLIVDNSWHHCAIVRDESNNVTLYVDGVSRGTGTDSTNYTSTSGTWFIGCNDLNPTLNNLTGYIEDLRITKGLARYTANFTPPTSELLG